MLNIQQNISLKSLNTLAIDVLAKCYLELDDSQLIPAAIEYARNHQSPVMLLGGGSNIVLTKDFDGLVIRLLNKGVSVSGHEDEVIVTAQAGENWHDFVMSCLQQGYYGLENLALIPGNVGAAAIQNIGAYGVELESVFYSLKGWHLDNSEWLELNKEQCQFAYRDSVFKHQLKDKFVISEVSFKLSTKPTVAIKYKALADYFKGGELPSPHQVAEAVIAIRSAKLPAPEGLPNAGSFFKNPIIASEKLEQLQKIYPEMVFYPLDDGLVKLAAAWLIDTLGWKGKAQGAIAMHSGQALVLTNSGGSGAEVLAYAEAVVADVYEHFGVKLEIEPRVY